MEDQSETRLEFQSSGRPLATSRSPARNQEDAPGGPGPIQFVYENPKYMTSSPYLEYSDVDSNRSADSLEFEEPIHLYHCTVSGCKVTCKRPYELNRHRQTVHNQSQHWFCPFGYCWLSCTDAGFATTHFRSKVNFVKQSFDYHRRPLTSKLLVSSEDDGYAKFELNGFTRKDKLTGHLKKAHKDDFSRFGGTLFGKDCSKERPLICDVQLFWINPTSDTPGSVSTTSRTWYPSPLWRLQLEDGTWSAYVGRFSNAVAEAGFRSWTKQDDEIFERLGQDHKFIEVVPWQANELILKLGSDVPMPKWTALQEYQLQIMLLEQQNKKRLMMARQQQDASSSQSHDPPLGSWTTETQYPSNRHGTSMSDASAPAQPECVLESVPTSCIENLQHNASVPALSPGFESTPGPFEKTRIETGTLHDAGVEAECAKFDWDALLSVALNSGSDSNCVAVDSGENPPFEFNDPAFDSNNPAGDLENLGFNFNELTSVPDWYFDVENATEPGL